MITPDEIKKKALRIWNSGQLISARSTDTNIFPIIIPFGKISGSSVSDNYGATARWIESLIDRSKEKRGAGYSLEFKEVSHRQLGRQRIPYKIYIETEADLLLLCGKKKEFLSFQKAYLLSEEKLPKLTGFIARETVKLIPFFPVWEKLIDVCDYFLNALETPLYIRQIVIPGIDTKFIENHKKIIADMLIYLDPEKYGIPFPGIAGSGFEKYFGLRFDEPLVRFRILDKELYINGFSDITLPVSQFDLIGSDISRVFVTENKINGLTFPMVKKSIVIFGMGYGISLLNNVLWLKNCEIFYWGDIDTHGFSILSSVRKIFPQSRSFLMNEEVLLSSMDRSVQEPESKRFMGVLSGLTESELKLFNDLKSNRFGTGVRLEQEMIPFDQVLHELDQIIK